MARRLEAILAQVMAIDPGEPDKLEGNNKSNRTEGRSQKAGSIGGACDRTVSLPPPNVKAEAVFYSTEQSQCQHSDQVGFST